MWRAAALAIFLCACRVDLALPAGAHVACENDDDCVGEDRCQQEIGLCLGVDAVAPRQRLTFTLPRENETNVSTTTTIVLAFALPVALDALAARVHVVSATLGEAPLSFALAEESTVSVTPESELAPLHAYTLVVDAGVPVALGALALPTDDETRVSFITAERRDRDPPAPVANVVVDRVSNDRADLSWTNPVDPRLAGVLVLRKANGGLRLDPSAPDHELPTSGLAYAVGAAIGDAEVAGIVRGEGLSFVGLSSPAYDWALFALDEAGNYSTPKRVPYVDTTSLVWCPSESGTFSVSSPDPGTYALDLTPVAAAAVHLEGGVLGTTTAFSAADVALGTSYSARFTIVGAEGTLRTAPAPFVAARKSLAPLGQPAPSGGKVGLGGTAVFGFTANGWPALEAAVDTDPAPAASVQAWQPLALTTTLDARAPMNFGGFFQLRVRPVVPGCADAEWIVSDEFTVGGGVRYVSAALGSNANDGLSRLSSYATIEKALADADGINTMDIHIAQGTYLPVPLPRPGGCNNCGNANDSPNGLVLKSKVRLYGGYASDFLSRDPAPVDNALLRPIAPLHETIINGNLNSEDYEAAPFDSQACRTALAFLPAAQGVVIDGVTIQPVIPPSGRRCGVHISRWTNVTIANSRVRAGPYGSGGGGNLSMAIQMRCGAAVTITRSDIQPRSDHADELALYADCLNRVSTTTLTDNYIGSGQGILVSAQNVSSVMQPQPKFVIDHNRIEGNLNPGAPTDKSVVGVRCSDHADLQLTNNVITPGLVAFGPYGSIAIDKLGSCQGIVDGNIIDGGTNVQTSLAVQLEGPVLGGQAFVVSNNLISAGRGSAERRAIRISDTQGNATHFPEVFVVHNHVFAIADGLVLPVDATILVSSWFESGYGSRIVNNFFFGVWQKRGRLFEGGKVGAFDNNVIATDANLSLYSDNGTHYYDRPNFEAQMCSSTNYAKYQNPTRNNAALGAPLAATFVSFGGVDGLPETLEDNDWRPAASATALRIGLASTQNACGGPGGTVNACITAGTRTCGNVVKDRAGTTRPAAPTTAGAYELPP
ncbi:MAG: Ig-like domain-containing protein [Deltaproteobacteria bacterium]|nr:Ig-like domain-containing protein [Deltaproteobacteria bacterium]